MSLGVLGTLATGSFVGLVLGQAPPSTTKPTTKAAVTIIGAALGGVPMAFLGNASTQWAYPVGLLLGLSVGRIYNARSDIASKWNPRAARSTMVLGWFAWFDLIAIAGVLATTYAIYADFCQ
jgi:hypothetical protein